MATIRQKKLAKNMVENLARKKPLTKQELVVSSGYSMNTATQQIPAVFEQKGVLEELEVLGFTENNAKTVVAEIMLNKEADNSSRLKATDQVFKVKGSYAPTESTTKNLNIEVKIENVELEAIRKEYEEKLKEKLTQ